MHDLTILRDLVILVAVAIPVVAATQRLRVPSIVGFLLTGLAIGPHALAFIADSEEVRGLAEIGVVLLLFTIGLELSLSRIVRAGRLVVQGGGLQVVSTLLVAAGVAHLGFDVPVPRAVFYGALVALSSTAVVLRLYADRGELDTPHGRIAVAILLFQDLCIVPLMLLTPLLAGARTDLGAALWNMTLGLVLLAALVGGGRFIVPWILERVVGVRNRELFTLTIVLFGLGAAYLTASVGMSLALGAFLAGLVISESPYGLQALSDVRPFRDTFSGVFFISVGMLLDVRFVADHPVLVFGVAAAIVIGKAILASLATKSLRRRTATSVLAGMGLAQVGEFSFVLALVGLPLGLLGEAAYQVFLGTAVTTMLAAPLVIGVAPAFARLVCRLTRERAVAIPPHEETEIAALADHVVIVGFGLNGRNLARTLEAAGIPFVILEQNGQAVREARRQGQPVYFGDGTRIEVLERVGIARARVLVFAIASLADERRGVATARQASPDVRIVVRTRYVAAVEDLRAHGADVVVPEEFETSIEIFATVLRLYGVPRNVVEREVTAVRGEGYEMLRGLSMPDLRLDALKHLGVHQAIESVLVEDGSRAVDENPATLALRRETGATVLAVVRDAVAHYTPDPRFRFRPGDTVVLVGDRDALDRATAVFRRPGT